MFFISSLVRIFSELIKFFMFSSLLVKLSKTKGHVNPFKNYKFVDFYAYLFWHDKIGCILAR